MTTLDGFRLPLTAGKTVYLEVHDAHYQSWATLNHPSVVTSRMVAGCVCPEGWTAVFPWKDGPLIKHLTQCRVASQAISLE